MGASLLFFPEHPQADTAKEALLHVVRRDPHTLGVQSARWKLADLLETCEWLHTSTQAGLWQVLHRLGIHYKRARDYVHSPDVQYDAKLTRLDEISALVTASGGRDILLYLDEMTYYRQPTLGWDYEQSGIARPVARRSWSSNTPTRVIGTLEAHTGRVICEWKSKIGLSQLVGFYQRVVQSYAQATRIWMVQDNWPVHVHPDVLVALEEQLTPFAYPRSPSWSNQPSPQAVKRWGQLHLPIQIVQLPTYASWCNPIEKLWRYLRQEVLHLHRQATDLSALRQQVMEFFERFAHGSFDLLRYVGLSIPY